MSLICPHCGERFTIEEKTNATGDNIQRGVCPTTEYINLKLADFTVTPWEKI